MPFPQHAALSKQSRSGFVLQARSFTLSSVALVRGRSSVGRASRSQADLAFRTHFSSTWTCADKPLFDERFVRFQNGTIRTQRTPIFCHRCRSWYRSEMQLTKSTGGWVSLFLIWTSNALAMVGNSKLWPIEWLMMAERAYLKLLSRRIAGQDNTILPAPFSFDFSY